ncbi:MAG: hypothetical protein KIT14_10745 [bacterium]|nr:hypothetical protein [bacterium]
MQPALVAAVLLTLVSVAHAKVWKGTLTTAEGSTRVTVIGLLVGSGDRIDGRWYCRGSVCPVKGAKIRFKCAGGGFGVSPTTEGILWTGRRKSPRRKWQLANPAPCEVLFPTIQATLFLADGNQGLVSLKPGPASPSGAFLDMDLDE